MPGTHLQIIEALETPFAALANPQASGSLTELAEPDRRLSALAAITRLQDVIERGACPAIGLHAARKTRLGHVGALDYLVASANTVDDAFQTLKQHMHLVSEALAVHRETAGDRTIIYFNVQLPELRAAWDFVLGGIYWSHRATVFSEIEGLECWFPYPEPHDLSHHRMTFGTAELRFSSLVAGYVFPTRYLQRRLPRADAALHSVLARHADQVRDDLPASDSIVPRVLDKIEERTQSGVPCAIRVASELAMSPRTLGRKLEQEGTTYSDVVSGWRKRQTLHFLSQPRPDIGALSGHLGYSHPVGFHRAFKRWTGMTPLTYHRLIRRPSGRASPQPM